VLTGFVVGACFVVGATGDDITFDVIKKSLKLSADVSSIRV
jgi:hypothetical protein